MSERNFGAQASTVSSRKVLPMARSEMERRWSAVRAMMRERDLESVIAWARNDFHGGYVKWLTDAPAFNPRTVIFHVDGTMNVIEHGANNGIRQLNGRDLDHPGVESVSTVWSVPTVHFSHMAEVEAVIQVLKKRDCRRIGWLNPGASPYRLVSSVQEILTNVVSVDVTDEVDAIKAIKSPAEIEQVRHACTLQDKVFDGVLQRLTPGMREFEVTAIARSIAEQEGSEQALFLISSAPVGTPGVLRNRHWQGRMIEKGDIVSILIENNAPGGFYAEFSRTIAFGTVPRAIEDLFDSAVEAQDSVARRLVPGASCGEISETNDAFLEERGWPKEDRLLGHSQGYDLVERPILRPDEPMLVAENMYFSIHPTVQTQKMHMSLCDNFLATSTGGERLHRTARRIFIR